MSNNQKSLRASELGVRVKGLEWGKTSYGRPEVDTIVGVYRVFEHVDGGWAATLKTFNLVDPHGRKNFATEEEAIAAVEVDYERRILSAIMPSSSEIAVQRQLGSGEPAAWSYELATRILGGVTGDKQYTSFESRISLDKPNVPEGSLRNLRPLYSAPQPKAVTEEDLLAGEILTELIRARTKFPGKNVTFAALVEEVGELATATFEESRDRVRKEAVQVAVMAMRMVLDGDHTFDNWRAEKGLDPLTAALSSEAHNGQ